MKVILGEERESTGVLISIDINDGVVKLDKGSITMFQLSFLCKMAKDAD